VARPSLRTDQLWVITSGLASHDQSRCDSGRCGPRRRPFPARRGSIKLAGRVRRLYQAGRTGPRDRYDHARSRLWRRPYGHTRFRAVSPQCQRGPVRPSLLTFSEVTRPPGTTLQWLPRWLPGSRSTRQGSDNSVDMMSVRPTRFPATRDAGTAGSNPAAPCTVTRALEFDICVGRLLSSVGRLARSWRSRRSRGALRLGRRLVHAGAFPRRAVREPRQAVRERTCLLRRDARATSAS
jgi:hypothetical protein